MNAPRRYRHLGPYAGSGIVLREQILEPFLTNSPERDLFRSVTRNSCLPWPGSSIGWIPMPIRPVRRLLALAPSIVLVVQTLFRSICGDPSLVTQKPSNFCPIESSSADSSCRRCPLPQKTPPTRQGCTLRQEELAQPASRGERRDLSSGRLIAIAHDTDIVSPSLRLAALVRRLEVKGASPPLQLLLVTFRN